jgi:hypothetical protein
MQVCVYANTRTHTHTHTHANCETLNPRTQHLPPSYIRVHAEFVQADGRLCTHKELADHLHNFSLHLAHTGESLHPENQRNYQTPKNIFRQIRDLIGTHIFLSVQSKSTPFCMDGIRTIKRVWWFGGIVKKMLLLSGHDGYRF